MILVLVSPLMFAASLWLQSWPLYAGFGVALSLGLGFIVWAWFKTPTGDGAWPFAPADGPAPSHWAPEVAFWLRWSAFATGALLAIGALAWGLTSTGLIGFNTFLGSAMIVPGIIALVGWPFLFPAALANALHFARRRPHQDSRISILPYKLRMRRQRFYENWPNVDGWG